MKHYQGHRYWRTHLMHEFKKPVFGRYSDMISKPLYAIYGPIVKKKAEEEPYLTSAVKTRSYINQQLFKHYFVDDIKVHSYKNKKHSRKRQSKR